MAPTTSLHVRAPEPAATGSGKLVRSVSLVALVGAVVTLTACNRTDDARSAVGHDVNTTAIPGAPPPLTAEPTIDPERVFADAGSSKLPPSKGALPESQEINNRAQEAAAMAPDTASADAAKKRVLEEASSGHDANPAKDTPANNPRHGALTADEESTSMPKAGQVNNHSSTALEADSGRSPR